MMTYKGQRDLFGTLTNNSSPTNLSLGDTLINNSDADIINKKHWDFLEAERYTYSVASQQFYSLPIEMDDGHIKSIYVTIGTTTYVPQEVPSRDFWNALNESNIVYSDIPEWYFVSEEGVGFYPISSTGDGTAPNSNKITMVFELKRKNISVTDYTTGSILSVANGGILVTGNGTNWTTKMNGFFICINDSLSDNTGDGRWYEIDEVTSTTSLNLVRPYGGLSISAGTATYTIGQTSLLPEDFQILPVWMACQIYFTSIQPEPNQSALYKNLYLDGMHRLDEAFSDKGTSPVIGNEDEIYMKNPNLYIQ